MLYFRMSILILEILLLEFVARVTFLIMKMAERF
jgi:hypothetical protein